MKLKRATYRHVEVEYMHIRYIEGIEELRTDIIPAGDAKKHGAEGGICHSNTVKKEP